MQSNWRLGLIFSLTTAVMWGLLPLSLKGILPKMDAVTVTWYRFALPAIIAFIWYGYRSSHSIKHLFSKQCRTLMLLTASCLLVNYILYILGLSYSTASAAQITIQLAPLLLLIGSVIIFKESFSSKQWLGVIAFTVGLLLFFHHRLEEILLAQSDYSLGVILVIFAAIAWAGFSLAQKQLLKFESTNTILLVLYLIGTVAFFPFSTPAQILSLNSTELALLAFASLNTIIAYTCFGLAMTHWEGSRVSATITIAPLLTLAFAELLALWQPDYMPLEPLSWLSWIGAVLVVVGSLIAALASSKRLI